MSTLVHFPNFCVAEEGISSSIIQYWLIEYNSDLLDLQEIVTEVADVELTHPVARVQDHHVHAKGEGMS